MSPFFHSENQMPELQDKKRLLFLSRTNSARSQIAEFLAHDILGPEFEIASAGTEPNGRIHPLTIEVLNEIGIEPHGARPKSLFMLDGHVRSLVEI